MCVHSSLTLSSPCGKYKHIVAMSTSPESIILKPGTNIRPTIGVKECGLLLKKLYGITCDKITELNGYDDKNFKISANLENIENPYIQMFSDKQLYVLKVLNSLESKKIDFIDGQNELLLFLATKSIKCPKPVQTTTGKYYTLQNLESGSHIVRLMVYLPGEILQHVPHDYDLLYDVGQNVAIIDQHLKGFHHDAYLTHKSLWMLDAVPELHNFLYAIEDAGRRKLISEIIQEFESDILQHADDFEKGILHGDCNEHNILVTKNASGEQWKFEAMLDFGDTNRSCYLFEVAVTMLYMMLLNNDLIAGGHVLAGYNAVRALPEREIKSLRISIAARLCQSLTMGAYSSQLDPKNSDYLLTTAKKGWDLLDMIWNCTNDELITIWMGVIKSYNHKQVN